MLLGRAASAFILLVALVINAAEWLLFPLVEFRLLVGNVGFNGEGTGDGVVKTAEYEGLMGRTSATIRVLESKKIQSHIKKRD